MIPRRYIEEWKAYAPWPDNLQVEQDLVIERAMVEMFSDEMLRKSLAFRGGTALHKLFLPSQARYSEDIDLVQINEGLIKPILKQMREKLQFLGTKRMVNQKARNNTVIYRFDTEIPPVVTARLKLEINCREHFSVLGLQEVAYKTESSWFPGECTIMSYQLEELLGTKLRALYQRRKGRDLFDLWWVHKQQEVDIEKLLACYREYMRFSVDNPPTGKQFLRNLEEKITDPEFERDIVGLLRPGIEYSQEEAFEWVRGNIIDKIG